MKHHPDISNETSFELELYLKEINKAYNLLKKERSKIIYDKFCESSNYNKESFNKLSCDSLINKKDNKVDGEDIFLICGVSLEQISENKSIKIRYNALVECLNCNNMGRIPATNSIKYDNYKELGMFSGWQEVPTNTQNPSSCEETGLVNVVKCSKCNANGRILGKRIIEFKANTKTKEGSFICFNKKGEAGMQGGLTGNLQVKTITKSHEFYIKNSLNLYCIIQIKPITAMIGGRIILTTITKSLLSIIVPKQNWNGLYLTENGKGLMDGNGNIGNINIRLILKHSSYRIITSFKLSTRTLIALYKVNRSLEMSFIKTNNNDTSHLYFKSMVLEGISSSINGWNVKDSK
ncbi:Chaperone protein DnaJ [Candidatus Hodgkinia cicadicola]|uniref:Chaperone protein DnaJ n=1 Tax=Candidatus Hodgkinia cicadicola TaxID=573658 RepID=A0ABX4MHE6_9HYPH|nr:Chaperone protein DnaJ [Candidatus Hodgkinia cicadicola]